MAQRSATEYFTGLASVYADHRPSYPIEAIDWVLHDLAGARPLRIADVGCGTGISTRLLALRAPGPRPGPGPGSGSGGASVIGIDPNRDMLDEARRASGAGEIDYRIGTGERTGLVDASVDLVVCAQSFHWFDPPAKALAEFHRILHPGGRLALMWNIKEPSNPFSGVFTCVAERAMADAATRGLVVRSEREADPTRGGYFANIQSREFPNPQDLDFPGVLGRIRSASYFPRPGNPLRETLERQLREAFDTHQRNGRVTLVHRTEVTLVERR
jgi:ubiquinone/menaquinone biosynthesis C-methylase UbiE